MIFQIKMDIKRNHAIIKNTLDPIFWPLYWLIKRDLQVLDLSPFPLPLTVFDYVPRLSRASACAK